MSALRQVTPITLERRLRKAWARQDAIAAQAVQAAQDARRLERQLAASYGYGAFVRREALELAMRQKEN